MFHTKCIQCGRQFEATNARRTCSQECQMARQTARRTPPPVLPCGICGTPVHCTTPTLRVGARRGKVYCSPGCLHIARSKTSSVIMARTNRKYASGRMKSNNPMKNPLTRAKVSAAMTGRSPILRMGNGTGPTSQEAALSQALGWATNVVVKTKMPMGSGYPTCYKIDVGCKEMMVGIEVDGNSHKPLARQAQDHKKELFLTSRGWLILRFWNHEVDQNLERCLQIVKSSISKWNKTTTTSPMAS